MKKSGQSKKTIAAIIATVIYPVLITIILVVLKKHGYNLGGIIAFFNLLAAIVCVFVYVKKSENFKSFMLNDLVFHAITCAAILSMIVGIS